MLKINMNLFILFFHIKWLKKSYTLTMKFNTYTYPKTFDYQCGVGDSNTNTSRITKTDRRERGTPDNCFHRECQCGNDGL